MIYLDAFAYLEVVCIYYVRMLSINILMLIPHEQLLICSCGRLYLMICYSVDFILSSLLCLASYNISLTPFTQWRCPLSLFDMIFFFLIGILCWLSEARNLHHSPSWITQVKLKSFVGYLAPIQMNTVLSRLCCTDQKEYHYEFIRMLTAKASGANDGKPLPQLVPALVVQPN